jgi:hypothetical protein
MYCHKDKFGQIAYSSTDKIMNWISFTNPSSRILMTLKIIAGASFILLGLLFVFADGKWIEGAILVSVSFTWLFFVIRNYKKGHMDLESLR